MKKTVSFLVAIVVLLGSLTHMQVSGAENAQKEVSIVFSHDTHSYLQAVGEDGSVIESSARIKSFIDNTKEESEAVFVLDAGDFAMGTLYQAGYEEHALELITLGKLGYDAVTIGNHEFDYGVGGLANMLDSAVRKAGEDTTVMLPQLLYSATDWTKNTSDEQLLMKKAMENYGSREYTIIERGGVKAAVFGLLGNDAIQCSTAGDMVFENYIEKAKEIVAAIQKEDTDIIICLSHSGLWEDPDKSEDELLAMAVPEIDVIISGHTHTTLNEPLVHGNTYIASCGEYNRNIGKIELKQNPDGRWSTSEYRLYKVAELEEEDDSIIKELEEFRGIINSEYLAGYGYTMDQVIVVNHGVYEDTSVLRNHLDANVGGEMIAESYIHTIKEAEGSAFEDIAFAIVPSGVIRATLPLGEVKLTEVFKIMSLGIGEDGFVGYPLVSVYLTGKELKNVAELDASFGPLITGAFLFPAGGGWEYNPNRLILNRVTDVWVYGDDGTKEEPVDDRLYRVVTDMYSCKMLSSVKDQSFGLLSMVPKDKDGNPVEDFNDYIVYDGAGNEIKAWTALANYLSSFDSENGYPVIKEAETPENKVLNDSKNIVELLKKPNAIFFAAVAIVILVAALFTMLIRLIVKRVKRIRERKAEKNRGQQ